MFRARRVVTTHLGVFSLGAVHDDHVPFLFAVADGDQGMLVNVCYGALPWRCMCHTR
jgi:hypothetical protein